MMRVQPKGQIEGKGQPAIALSILQDTMAEEGEIIQSSNIPGQARTCSEVSWRNNCYARMFENDTTRTTRQKAFVRAAKTLHELKLIGKYGDRVWLV